MKFIILILILMGCASNDRTPYQALSKDQGFSDKEFDGPLRIATFMANQHTKDSQAQMFAKFRALEVCKNEGKSHAFIMDTIDRTHSEKVIHMSNNGYPSYYYGMAPFNNRYSSFGLSLSSMRSQAWEETKKWPHVEVIYQCLDKVFAPLVEFREIPATEMKHLVKDLRGALQVERVPPESPNKDKIKKGDVLLRVNGERIQEVYQLMKVFNSPDNVGKRVDILRDGDNIRNIVLEGKDVTENIQKSEQVMLSNACEYDDLKTRVPCLR